MKTLRLLLPVMLLVLIAAPAWADTWPVSTCTKFPVSGNSATVAATIAAATDGDVICLPSGTYTWTQGMNTCNIFSGIIGPTKCVSLIGAGAFQTRGAATTGGTTIFLNFGGSGSNTVAIQESGTYQPRISNITWMFGGGNAIPDHGILIQPVSNAPLVKGQTVRVDHNTFQWALNNTYLNAQGGPWGQSTIFINSGQALVDKNKFIFEPVTAAVNSNLQNTTFGVKCLLVKDSGGANVNSAITQWETPGVYGDADTNGTASVYVENNYFEYDEYGTEVDEGCRMVIRYNDFYSSRNVNHGADTSVIGARHFEVYNNTYTCGTADGNVLDWNALRGGTAIVTANTFGSFAGPGPGTPAGGGNCNASSGKTNRPAVEPVIQKLQRTDAGCWHALTWPVIRQIGWGWSGGATQTAATTDGDGNSTNQDLEPTYSFSNTNYASAVINPTNNLPDQCGDGLLIQDFFKVNREWFSDLDSVSCTATPASSCTQGVGVGTFANRPTTCTHNVGSVTGAGVGYYATDTLTLYKCTAANTWTKYWARFTYPHPLAASDSGETSSGGDTGISGHTAPPGRRHWHGPHAKPERMEMLAP